MDIAECALLDIAYNEPNTETIAAINDARKGRYEGMLDVSSVEAMYESMGL